MGNFSYGDWSKNEIKWASVSTRVDELNPNEQEYICHCNDRPRKIEGNRIVRVEEKIPHVHWDRVAWEYGPAPLCMSGGFGSAKTFALCLKALYLSDLYPKNRGVIARKVAKELALTTQKTFFKLCPPSAYDPKLGGRRSDQEGTLRLAGSESEIIWLHLEHDDVDKVVRGLEVNWFLIDQAEEVSEEIFTTLMGRLGRWDQAEVPERVLMKYGGLDKWPWKNPETGRPIPPIYSMIACNPEVESHWIYQRFHPESTSWKEQYSQLGYRMLKLASFENKFLPDQNVQEMLNNDITWQRRFFYGEWGIPEGQIHNIRPESMVPGTHALAEFVKTKGTLHRTLDHGDSAPTCCGWWSVLQSGDYIGYREYYKANLLVSDHRKNLTNLSQQERYQTSLADPSMFYKTMQKYGGRWSFSDEYSDRNPNHGFDPETAIDWQAADNDEMGTRNYISELLRPQGTGQIYKGAIPRTYGNMTIQPGDEIPRVHPFTGEYGYWPRLWFLMKSEDLPEGIDWIVRHTKQQRRERIGTELGKPVFSDERDKGVPDHGYDVLRYFASSRAPVPNIPAKRYSSNSFFGRRDEILKFKRNHPKWGKWSNKRQEVVYG